MQQSPKVFFIGFNKTSTLSIHRLFLDSGYISYHNRSEIEDQPGINLARQIKNNIEQNNKILQGIDQADAYSDLNFTSSNEVIEAVEFFPEIYKEYPNSYYVLNTRSLKGWLQSRLSHKSKFKYLEDTKAALQMSQDEVIIHWATLRQKHYCKVFDFFKNKDNFLVFNTDSDDIDILVNFLKDHYSLNAAHWTKSNVTKTKRKDKLSNTFTTPVLKSFVITLEGVKESEELSDDCVNSCVRFDSQIEKFSGVYGEETISKKSTDLQIFPYKEKMKKNRIGVKGCFLSHYLLWQKCVRINEPIIIFEHDAILVRPVPIGIEEEFDEFLLLDPFNKFSKNYSNLHELHSKSENSIVEYFNPKSTKKYGVDTEYPAGLQAYIIKPKAALKLIREAENNGYRPADMHCNKSLLNIETVTCPIASVNSIFYNNPGLMKEKSTTRKDWRR